MRGRLKLGHAAPPRKIKQLLLRLALLPKREMEMESGEAVASREVHHAYVVLFFFASAGGGACDNN